MFSIKTDSFHFLQDVISSVTGRQYRLYVRHDGPNPEVLKLFVLSTTIDGPMVFPVICDLLDNIYINEEFRCKSL